MDELTEEQLKILKEDIMSGRVMIVEEVEHYKQLDDNLDKCYNTNKQQAQRIKELEIALEQNCWIPVTERLPEKTGYYLIICASEDYNEHRWWQFWYQNGWYGYNKIEDYIEDTEKIVTHWKPIILPEQALKGK